MSAEEAGRDEVVVAPEPVAVEEPELAREEEPDVDEPLVVREPVPVAVVWVDRRLPVPAVPTTAVLLTPERGLLDEPVAITTGVTKVEFWPAGTIAAGDWLVTAAGWEVAAVGLVVTGAG